MKTSYFTLGYGQKHNHNGIELNNSHIIKITNINPRNRMFELFGSDWSFQYEEEDIDEEFKTIFTGGIIEIK